MNQRQQLPMSAVLEQARAVESCSLSFERLENSLRTKQGLYYACDQPRDKELNGEVKERERDPELRKTHSLILKFTQKHL